jgi:hypothetical protein
MKYYDLVYADFTGANLNGCDFRTCYLNNANFTNTQLSGADLRSTDMTQANLMRANLNGVDLRGSDIKGVTLDETNFERANLRGCVLHAKYLTNLNFKYADLRECDLIDANLDESTLTGAKLWETKRSGWSIKGVICEYAYFDREGKEKTVFSPGEFEKLYSDQTKIVLHYEDGLTQLEVTTLPALIQFIESKHSGSSLRLRTIGEDAGGASVTIAVDELGDSELVTLQEDFEKYKEQIRDEVKRNAQFEVAVLQGQVNLLTGIIERKMGDTFNINKLIGVAKADSSTINQNIHTNDLDDISKLIIDLLASRPEIEKVLSPDKKAEFDTAIEVIQEQVSAPKKNWEKLKQGLQNVKNVLEGVGGVAGKWIPIVEKLYDAAHNGGLI